MWKCFWKFIYSVHTHLNNELFKWWNRFSIVFFFFFYLHNIFFFCPANLCKLLIWPKLPYPLILLISFLLYWIVTSKEQNLYLFFFICMILVSIAKLHIYYLINESFSSFYIKFWEVRWPFLYKILGSSLFYSSMSV